MTVNERQQRKIVRRTRWSLPLSKIAARRAAKRVANMEREEYLETVLRPKVREFMIALLLVEPEKARVKYIYWCIPRIAYKLDPVNCTHSACRISNARINIWLTSRGEIVTRHIFPWICGSSGGSPGVGIILPVFVGYQPIACFSRKRSIEFYKDIANKLDTLSTS